MSNSVAQAKEVLFYEPEDPNGYLSNLRLAPLRLVIKYGLPANTIIKRSEVRLSRTAQYYFGSVRLLKHFRWVVKNEDQVPWRLATFVLKWMQFIVTEKFRQNPQFALFSTNTGDSVIKEHSHKDHFWGDGGDGTGENHLGKILMAVRSPASHSATAFDYFALVCSSSVIRNGSISVRPFVKRPPRHLVLAKQGGLFWV